MGSSLTTRRFRIGLLFIPLLAGLMSWWRVSGRSLYWDDLLIPAKYSAQGFPSFTALFTPHDGHVMPGAIALQSFVSIVAPLQWWLPATLIVVGAVTSAVVWFTALGREHPWAVVAIVFSPFFGFALGWWSAAINALGWQLATGCAVWLMRFLFLRRHPTPRFFWAISGAIAVVILGGLLFTEKALSIVPVLSALAVVFPAFFGLTDRGSWRRLLLALLPAWVVTIGWAVLYFVLVGVPGARPGVADSNGNAEPVIEGFGVVFKSIPSALHQAVAPGVVGGPWSFDRWEPSMSFASPSGWAATLGTALVFVALVAWVFMHRNNWLVAFSPIVLSVGYLLAFYLALNVGRTGVGTTDLITRTMHYYSDWFAASVLFFAAAVAQYRVKIHKTSMRWQNRVGVLVAAAFVVSAGISTHAYLATWEDDPSKAWVDSIRGGLAQSTAPLLPQPIPFMVAHHAGEGTVDIGDIAAHYKKWPGVASATTKPQFLTDRGQLVPAGIIESATTQQGDVPQCGLRIPVGKPTLISISKPLPFGEWTWELNTTASTELDMRIATPNGLETYAETLERARFVRIPTELTTQFVRVSGGGGTIELLLTPPAGASQPRPNDHVCLGSGPIGPLLPTEQLTEKK